MNVPLTFGDIFAGGGGAARGALAAGLQPRWAVELDAAAAACYAANVGGRVLCQDAASVDLRSLEPVDVLWASPPCQADSQARPTSLPPRSDADIGRCVVAYVRALRPRALILENVPPYRQSPTFGAICDALGSLGYATAWGNVNAADYGVPQTRRRLILRAVRGGLLVPLPAPAPWRGWYDAVADLLPGLPESEFAPWQVAHLPALQSGALVRASFAAARGAWYREGPAPAFTVMASHKAPLRAFVVGQDGSADRAGVPVYGPPYRCDGEPIFTVRVGTQGRARAWLDCGRVVRFTARALARLQSFPDDFTLPPGYRDACRVVGNAVPPELAAAICRNVAQAIG